MNSLVQIRIFVTQYKIEMAREFENLLITVYGEDQPGVTSKLTGILANYDAQILDIGKADIQKNLSLGILFRAPMQYSGNIIKDLILICNEIGVTIKFKPISDEEYSNWVNLQGKNRYIVTILGRKLSAKHIASVAEIVSEEGLNIDGIKRLTGRIPLEENEQPSKASVEFSVRGLPTNKEDLQRKLMHLSTEMGIDISFQEDGMFRRMRRLICFDMDSTLIRTEVIDELAEKAGVGEQVKAITEAAMRGEIDFTESFKQRVALLKGLDESAMKEIADRLPITEGVDRLMYVLKRVGFKIAILSGGFTYFGNYLKRKYDIDYVYANNLEIKDGKLTGRHTGEIVDGNRKAELLKLIAQVENVDIRQTVAVGDGANDLPMLGTAGLGIAFHAKPKVKASAKQSISTTGIDGVLYFLGYKDSYMEESGGR